MNWLTTIKVQQRNTAGSDIQVECKQSDRGYSWPWEYWHIYHLRDCYTAERYSAKIKSLTEVWKVIAIRRMKNFPEEVTLAKRKKNIFTLTELLGILHTTENKG